MPNQYITPLCAPAPADAARDEEPPFVIEFVMVQGPGFRCPAYRDEDGRWRHALNNDELFGEIHILE